METIKKEAKQMSCSGLIQMLHEREEQRKRRWVLRSQKHLIEKGIRGALFYYTDKGEI